MENACTLLLKLPPCSQQALAEFSTTRSARLQRGAVFPSRVERVTLTRADTDKVNRSSFLRLGTSDRERQRRNVKVFDVNLHSHKRLQKATKKRPWEMRSSCSARLYRSPISSNCAPRVWLPSPWQRRADCLAFSVTPLIKRCAVITARGEEYIWARRELRWHVYLKWLLSFEQFKLISCQKVDAEDVMEMQKEQAGRENRMLVCCCGCALLLKTHNMIHLFCESVTFSREH